MKKITLLSVIIFSALLVSACGNPDRLFKEHSLNHMSCTFDRLDETDGNGALPGGITSIFICGDGSTYRRYGSYK